VVAVPIALVLAAGLARVAVEGRPGPAEQPAMAATIGLVSDVQVASPPAARAVSRSQLHRPRTRPAAPPPPPRGWRLWSSRIRGCESHGRPDAPPDYGAENPDSSASGAYQILDSTWAGRFGVTHASDATPTQQEQVAADEYRRGGTTAWAASAACWRMTT
jgi:hypothetical protein